VAQHQKNIDIESVVLDKLKAPNVCFLFGAGSSKAAGYPLMKELVEIAAREAQSDPTIAEALRASSACTIEDQLDKLFGQLRSPNLSQVSEADLRKAVDHILNVIFAECSKSASLDAHEKFVVAVQNRMSAKKQIHTFTTNYDMLFEWAADQARVHCINGFVGIQTRTFDPGQFEIRPARFVEPYGSGKTRAAFCPAFYLYKVHGSVSWVYDGDLIREAKVVSGAQRERGQLMVFPTPKKYLDVSQSPYSDLFTRMSDILNRKQTVLVSLGFGFGDAHIKALVERCLKDNTFILVVLSKDMLPTFDSFASGSNVVIVSENETIIGGRRYSVRNDLWDFSSFADAFAKS